MDDVLILTRPDKMNDIVEQAAEAFRGVGLRLNTAKTTFWDPNTPAASGDQQPERVRVLFVFS